MTLRMSQELSERDFERAADEELQKLEKRLSEVADIEVELSLGVLTIEFGDGAKFVINSHRAAKQIWMAADRTAWHFDPKGDSWVATKSGEELWATVTAMLTKKLGQPIALGTD